MKKVGVTFVKKSDLNNYSSGSKPKIFVNNRINAYAKPNFKPKPHNHQHASGKQEPSTNRGREAYQEKDKATAAASPDVICFNCDEHGHYARDCKKPKRNKEHVRAAHTAIVDEEEADDTGQEYQASEHNDQQPNGSQGHQSDDDELVEIDVYDNNDWYERESDSDPMFAIREADKVPATRPHKDGLAQDIDKTGFRKVHLRADKTARPRPEYTPEEKECLATFVSIGGYEAWALWDSGSTTTGLTPAFAQVADLRVFPLTNPHTLQLGTVGSRATVNYGADVRMEAPGISDDTYVDIANFDRYDMIIGTPFMNKNKVILDFENKQVIVNGKSTPAVKVLLGDNDARLRRYRSVDRRKKLTTWTQTNHGRNTGQQQQEK
jgi:hypothetical protein